LPSALRCRLKISTAQDDVRMAAIFGANTAFCLAVVALTAYKRRAAARA